MLRVVHNANIIVRRCFCSNSRLHDLFATPGAIPKFWERELLNVDRGSAKALVNKLVNDNILGFPGAVEKKTLQKDLSKVRVADLACAWKRANPEMVLLVRIGDFYEAWGVDAVMLVQHAGLNPMGDSCRAGCPKNNIQQTLNSLTDAGLTVAVYEEANVVGTKAARTKKERYLSQVVTPGRSIYLHDTCLKEGEIVFRESKPYAAIRCTQDGCGVGFFSVDSKELRMQEGLTEEALGSLIDSVGGIAEPVWLSADSASRFARLKTIILPYYRTRKISVSLSFEAMLGAVSTEVCRLLSLDARCVFKQIRKSCRNLNNHQTNNGLRPPHTAAAQFLGLSAKSASAPDLVKFLLPHSAPFHSQFFFRNWLLCPPPLEIVNCMHAFVGLMKSTKSSLPRLRPVPVNKLVRLLESSNGNHHFFLDLADLCNSFLSVSDEFLTPQTLKIVSFSSGIPASDFSAVRASVTNILQAISETVNLDVAVGVQEDESSFGRFTRMQESEFSQIVKSDFSLLNLKRSRLHEAITVSLVCAGDKALKYDQMSDKLYVKDANTALRPGVKMQAVPDDSRKRFSSEQILEAETEYRVAAEEARRIAKQAMQNLCRELTTRIETLVFISHLAVVISSVALHVEAALRKGWTLPIIKNQGCDLKGVWPYWLEVEPAGTAVANSFTDSHGKKISLLTAPNMTGKSTLIRSIAASALLGNCGLMVPCHSAEIGIFSNILVVSPSGDRPAEGLSAFAAEAEAMAVALRHSKTHGQVMLLVDEFGRGTSGSDASALSTAIINWLSENKNVTCIWATHLHELFTLCNHLLDIHWVQMKGFHLVPGKCLDSKGIETALNHGFPREITDHAFVLRKQEEGTHHQDVCPVSKIAQSVESARIVELDPSSNPPPSVLASPVLYILKFPNDAYYVGETENFLQRLKAHKGRFGQAPLRIWISQQDDRSKARALETLFIQTFLRQGVQLLSTVDGLHRSSSSALHRSHSSL